MKRAASNAPGWCRLIFYKRNSRHEQPAGLDFYELEKHALAPIHVPAALEFGRQNGDHCAGQIELSARLYGRFYEQRDQWPV